MAPGTTVHVSIAVFKGDPVDYQKYRHTALWFRFADQTPSVVMHAVGLQYEFLLKTEHDRNPTLSRTFAKEVQVGHLEQAMTKPQLVALVTQTPIKNSDPEFNCQQWVENVLRSPMDKKYLSKDQYNESLNGMTDATLEAEDESQAQV
ncbi:hypothetical protein IWX90DRAFT_486469 [Phyllosticta citrichinensis]|uniref:Uncharacterized protein n=1 Tax=Phyllosticta citrichinensis TaxID=1130410 RepID=A0ABR1XU03_9PEZI